jgi:drug/metabolite transporter (DMT)-like permease
LTTTLTPAVTTAPPPAAISGRATGGSAQTSGTALATMTALIWGGMFAVAASAMHRLDSYHLTLARYGAASVIFVALLVYREGRGALRPDGRGVRLFVLGTFGFAGFNLLSYLALSRMSPASAALIVATSPIIAAVVGWVQTRVRPPAFVLLAGGGAVLGVSLVLGHGNPMAVARGTAGLGSLFVLLGVTCFVVYTRGAAEFASWSPLRYTTLTAIGGTASILIATEIAESTGSIGVPTAGDYVAVLPQLVYVVLLAAVVAVLSWNGAVRRIGVLQTSVFITLVPVTAFVIDAVRGATVHAGDLLGIALVIVSLIGANLAQRRLAPAH